MLTIYSLSKPQHIHDEPCGSKEKSQIHGKKHPTSKPKTKSYHAEVMIEVV